MLNFVIEFGDTNAVVFMVPAHLLLQLMYFVTDCDGTIVHYNCSQSNDLLELSPSAGSGKIGFISKGTVSLLQSIENDGAKIICASGMRLATMEQRQAFFPSIKYWICENGGRIFTVEEDGVLQEIDAWKRLTTEADDALASLRAFALRLKGEGWAVDEDYLSMIRVKGADLRQLLTSIPENLKSTFNLGYLDVHLPHAGKLPAVRWLLARLSGAPDAPFLFMGDDDNDVEIAAAAKEAFVVTPCSEAIAQFVSTRMCVNGVERESVVNSVHVADVDGPPGTNFLLTKVLRGVVASKMDNAPIAE